MDDDDLVRRIEHERTWIVSLARGLVIDSDAAEDLAQEAFLAALRHPPRDISLLRPWLLGVLRNLSRHRTRTEVRRERREARAARPERRDEDPGASIERLELRQQLIAALLALEEPYRTAVVLRHVEEVPIDEIARRTGAPAGTVRSWVSRGLERVRAHLDRIHGGDRDRWLIALIAAAAGVMATPAAGAAQGGTGPEAAPAAAPLAGASSLARTAAWLAPVLLVVAGALYFWPEELEPAREPARRDAADETDAGARAAEEETTAVSPAPSAEAEPGAPVAGTPVELRILAPDGSPAPGAEIAWLPAERHKVLQEDLDLPNGTSGYDLAWRHGERALADPSGAVRCKFPEGGLLIAVRATSGSWAGANDDRAELPLEIELVAHPIAKILDENGNPVAGAWISISSNDGKSWQLRVADAEALVDFAWSRVHSVSYRDPLHWRIRSGYPALDPGDTPVTDGRIEFDHALAASAGALTIRLDAEAQDFIRLERRLFTLDWAGAEAVADPDLLHERFRLGGLRFNGQADGVIVIPRAGAGLALRAACQQCEPAIDAGPANGEGVALELGLVPGEMEVSFTVVDEAGSPVADQRFDVLYMREHFPDRRIRWASGRSDDQGRAVFWLDRGEAILPELLLVPKSWPPLETDAERRAAIHLPAELPRRLELPPVVIGPAPVIAAGVLLDPTGAPIPGVGIEIDLNAKEGLSSSQFKEDRSTVTDPRGRFAIRGDVRRGRLAIRAVSDDVVIATAVAEAGDPAIELRAVSGLPVTLVGRLVGSAGQDFRSYRIGFAGGGGIRDTTADRDGAFSMRGLPVAGEVWVWGSGKEVVRLPLTVPVGVERFDMGDVDLGGEVESLFTDRELFVSQPDGTPALGPLEIYTFTGRHIEALSPVVTKDLARGRFRIPFPRTAERLALRDRLKSAWTVVDPWLATEVRLRPRIQVEVEVLDAGAPGFEKGLRVDVVEPPRDGLPVDELRPMDGIELDPEGRVRFEVSLAGSYAITWSRWVSGNWQRVGKSAIEITDVPEQRIAVRVLEAR